MPSLTEWKLTAGIWAVGFGIFTVAVKITAQVLTGGSRLETLKSSASSTETEGV